MDWPTTFVGSVPVPNIVIDDPWHKPNLEEETLVAIKEARRLRKEAIAMKVLVTPEALCGEPINGGSPVYQPIGKIVYVNAHTEGALKKQYMFTFVASDEGTRIGGPHATYTCFVFKCKSDTDATTLAFATARTMATNAQRRDKVMALRQQPFDTISHEDKELAVRFWNASSQRIHQLEMTQDGKISGPLKVHCQADATARAIVKVVRLTNFVCGDELVHLLAEKFNLGEIDLESYAVFDTRDTGEHNMLADDQSPISVAITLMDPAETTFVFRKLSPGLVRMSKAPSNKGPDSHVDAAARSGDNSSTRSGDALSEHRQTGPAVRRSSLALTGIGGETSTDDDVASPLGPLLPYHPDDEDLLLEVMITRQSGSGLGFKLTPAYLLQMCIAYSSIHRGNAALKGLLNKIAEKITGVVTRHPDSSNMLLFWASNTLKLMGALLQDPAVFRVLENSAKQRLDAAVDNCLEGIDRCATRGQIPPELQSATWTNRSELRAVIIDYYRQLDQNMSPDLLREVVDRITRAMPSTNNDEEGAEDQGISVGDTTQRLGFSAAAGNNPLTSTPVQNKAGDARAGPPQQPPSSHGHSAAHEDGASSTAGSTENGMPPLPDEWEELIDQETKHRFFANHKTRQTSWTDPRDKLVTVNLVKGNKGLGLGISGAKRTRDGKFVLGIFVTSLVPGSAADVDGTLRDGDEILEVNGHSLIGVSREGAIEFLKKVQLGETITLLVAQEPRADLVDQLRHTAL
ncbi:uncharacterized protein MONBRDRAFT_27690 [Monosiga brevicollis MX1]|uniref:PDZ domain-containing protein n=1 Tax=Monosiga brevicollis TaxID=81824 RepID=A9V612_MONBE|nr:uncharacterized protein MONBRDRAFT_27690 [Monosiga brevicollis MX1]EDQ86905.1 predicted protein [Monosiga brevicollis MX1]|eukprot:XP_001748144.1 hypothetical protein [Monosiga brevicollis MX1]